MWYLLFNKKIPASAVMAVLVCLILAGCDNEEMITPQRDSANPTARTIEVENHIADVTPQTTESEVPKPEEEPEDIQAAEPDPADFFTAEDIPDEVFARMQGNSFPEDCTVARDELRYLRLLYKDIEGNTHEGEMVCNKAIADKLTDIFRKLYDAGYAIEKITLIDDYGGDDDASMSDNNTSCFNYRVVSGTTKLSKHAMGLAVDLNPRYNPYIHTIDGATAIEPENGAQYADRAGDFPYKIDKEDLAYRLFTEAGFTWGGSWKSVKDYQHFQFDK